MSKEGFTFILPALIASLVGIVCLFSSPQSGKIKKRMRNRRCKIVQPEYHGSYSPDENEV